MSKTQVWIHYVWSTKNRQPFLTDEIRSRVFSHIRLNATEKGIYVDHIGGYLEHLHCLISLSKGQCFDKVAMLLKGESSHWINKNGLVRGRFAWQDDYFAESVGIPSLPAVRYYIRNQQEHHKKVSFADEWEKFLGRLG